MSYSRFAPHKLRLMLFEAFMILLALIYLYPFYAVLVLSVKSPSQALMSPMSLPRSIYSQNFVDAWQQTQFPRALFNTVAITALSVILIIALTGMGTFALSRMGKLFSNGMFYFFIAGLMIPFYLSLSPSVKLMKDLGLMDSINGISLSYIGRNVSFAVFLFMGFIHTIPGEIFESAVMDGCRPFRMFWNICFPMLKPTVSTLAILDSLAIWNDFLYPLLILQSNNNRTLTLVQYVFRVEANTKWNLVFAAYLMAMLPLLVLYFVLQKNIVEGIATGAVKG